MSRPHLGSNRYGTPSMCSDTPPSVSLSPDLDHCGTSVTEEMSLCTPSPLIPAEVSPEFRWDMLVQELNDAYTTSEVKKEPMPFVPMSTLSSCISVPSSPAWLLSTDPPSKLIDHTQTKRSLADAVTCPPKRMRSEIPNLLPMEPRPMAENLPRRDAVRAWLLERRALLQKVQDDVCRDMAGLRRNQAYHAELRDKVGARIRELKEHRTEAEVWPIDDDGIWSTSSAPMSSVADLLEKNILCL